MPESNSGRMCGCCSAAVVLISTHEPLGAEYGRELGLENFDRDVAVVLEILREVDRRHAAGAELALDAVSVGQRGCETVDHGRRASSRQSGFGERSGRSLRLSDEARANCRRGGPPRGSAVVRGGSGCGLSSAERPLGRHRRVTRTARVARTTRVPRVD